MKGKALLFLSCLFLTGCQGQVKQSVLAETTKTSASQQALLSAETSTSPSITEQPVETIESSEVVTASSIEEVSTDQANEKSTESSEEKNVNTSTTELTKTSISSSEVIKETTDSKTAAEQSLKEVQQVIQPPVTAAKVEENYQFSVVKNQTTEEFIQAIGKDAQQIAWDEGLYASVMIAQAILETGSGNSQLARPPHHNLFGIKGSYQGKQVIFNTQEDKGNGQLYTVQSAFRQYPSYKESLEDCAALLKKGLSGNPGFYQATWKEHAETYQMATKALTGKYATDTSYDKKLNALIETYQLAAYDQEPAKEEPPETLTSEVPSHKEVETRFSDSTQQRDSDLQETEAGVRMDQTRQTIQTIPPTAHRPAKELAGSRIVQ